MITARNYAAQAERGLTDSFNLIDWEKYPHDNKLFLPLAREIAQAVHFALPNEGEVFDDDFKGLYNTTTPLRLPYPQITIEYYFSSLEKDKILALQTAQKVVVLAREVTSSDINADLIDVLQSSDKYIALLAVAYFPQRKIWRPLLSWGLIPCLPFSQAENFVSTIFFTDLFTESFENNATNRNIEGKRLEEIALRPLLEFLEALSCKNITTEPLETISASTNARRIKDGKLPLYETKVLILDTKQGKSSSEGQGGSHASPRQHLRRGHIRRLPSGNIWVNSCIVGDATKGVIAKSYEVK